MTYVVTQACIKCKYTDCVEVCPQQAFREGKNFVVIDPGLCANCGLCELVCPVEAIKPEYALSPAEAPLRALNAELAAIWPRAHKRSPPGDAQEWSRLEEKLQYLDRRPFD